MRLVFMGTPEFAVESLKTLYNSHHEIAAVVTAADKPRGRGRRVSPSPIKEAAQSLGLPIMQPQNLKSQNFINQLAGYKPELNVVVAFRILPEAVFTLPALGSVNLHASLLPNYRGAAPINWVLINGETITGVTTFLLDKKVDTGAILLQREIEIAYDDDAGSLHDKLMKSGAKLLLKTVNGLEKGTIIPRVQSEDEASPAPKLTPETARIDWLKPAHDVVNLIRGLSPYPGAYGILQNQKIIMLKAVVVNKSGDPGEIVEADAREGVSIACGYEAIKIIKLKPQGKKSMGSAEFVRGYHVEVGRKLQS